MTVRVQDHIHIGFTLVGSGVNAPLEKYKATEVSPNFEGFIDYRRSLNGRPHIHTLTDDNGVPVVYQDFQYIIRFYDDETEPGIVKFERFTKLQYQPIYFVSHYHPDDNENHADYVRTMVIVEVKYESNLDPKLNFVTGKVVLKDYSVKGYGTGVDLSSIDPGAGGGSLVYLNDLQDVNAVIGSNVYLGWDTETEQWIGKVIASGGAGGDLDDLDDVVITSIVSGHIIQWNGSSFVNRSLTDAGIAAADHSHDAHSLGFTPTNVAEWVGGVDPGNIGHALDQLIEVANIALGRTAAAIEYAPDDNTDWDGDIDPGTTGNALDQLAARMVDVESLTTAVTADVVEYEEAVPTDWSAPPLLVSAALDELADRTQTLEDASSTNVYPSFSADAPLDSPNARDDEFADHGGGAFDVKWTNYNNHTSGQSTPTVWDYGVLLAAPNQDTVKNTLQALYQNAAAATRGWHIAKMSIRSQNSGGQGQYGIFQGDDIDDAADPFSFIGVDIVWNSVTLRWTANVVQRSYASHTASPTTNYSYPVEIWNLPKYFAVVEIDNSGNLGLGYYYSFDGINWILALAPTSYFTQKALDIGLMVINPIGSGTFNKIQVAGDFYRFIPSGSSYDNVSGRWTSVIKASNP